MDFWQTARSLAQEAAKKSHVLTIEAAKLSQELTKEAAKLSQDFVSETAKKSKELALDATKKADLIKNEALKGAGHIKLFTEVISSPKIPVSISMSGQEELSSSDLEKFGITEELREFVSGITSSTFKDFPMEDELQISDIPTVSNVRQDLTDWQAKHATLVLSTVKEISRLRYELCPRHMKERKFWIIYFILVNNHVAPYEKQYMEEVKMLPMEKKNDENCSVSAPEKTFLKPPMVETVQQIEPSSSSHTEKDLDTFLLGDDGTGDDEPDGGADLDDDFEL